MIRDVLILIRSFNSIVVRLKDLAQVTKAPHYVSFNSIVVRLKAPIKRARRSVSASFNSIVVRLKEHSDKEAKEKLESFNSIVVRLKVRRTGQYTSAPRGFQFHSGSIKRGRLERPGYIRGYVSIP